jgi:hypothetical protein
LRLLERMSDRRARGVCRVEQFAGALGEHFAFLGKADPARRAMQKARAQLAFELCKPSARHGCGQTEFPSRRR